MSRFHRPSRGLAWAAILSCALGLAACRKNLKPVPQAGSFAVSVLQASPTPGTSSSPYADVGGKLVLTYRGPEAANHEAVQSFSGIMEVPVKVRNGKDIYEITSLKILSTKNALLTELKGTPLEALKPEAPKGVLIRVILPPQPGPAPELQILLSSQPGGDNPNLIYKPLTEAFPDPESLLDTNDLEAARRRLRQFASATAEWHEDLLRLIGKADDRIDRDHLQLLLSGVYYPFEERQKLFEEYTKLLESGNATSPEVQQKLARLSRAIRVADDLGALVNRIVDAVLPKTEGLELPRAMEVLRQLFPLGGAPQAFHAVQKMFAPLPGPAKLALANLAREKNQLDVAIELASDWFEKDTDRSAARLLELVAQFKAESKDTLLLATAAKVSDLSPEKARTLVTAAYGRAGEVALALARKLPSLSGTSIASLGSAVENGAQRDEYLLAAVPLVASYTNEGARAVLAQATNRLPEVATAVLSRVTGLDGQKLAEICLVLQQPPARDQALEAGVRLLQSVDVAGAKAIVTAAGPKVVQIAVLAISRVPDLTGASLAEIASVSASASVRDSILINGSASLKSVTAAGLVAMVRTASEARVELARSMLPKVKDLTGLTLADVAGASPDGGERDQILTRGLELLSKVSVAGAKAVVQAGTALQGDLALALLPKLEAFDGVILADLANVSPSGPVRDRILEGGLPRLTKPSLEEAKAVVNAAFARKKDFACTLLTRLDPLSATATLELAGVIPSGAVKDAVLLEGIRLVKALTAAELMALLKAQGAVEREIALSGVEKVNDLTVANSVLIADAVSGANRDAFLERAVEICTDLSANNLLTLADKAFTPAGREEVIRRGLKKLGQQP